MFLRINIINCIFLFTRPLEIDIASLCKIINFYCVRLRKSIKTDINENVIVADDSLIFFST